MGLITMIANLLGHSREAKGDNIVDDTVDERVQIGQHMIDLHDRVEYLNAQLRAYALRRKDRQSE